jgi:putative membrane protein
MFWGDGYGIGWGWLIGLLLLLAVAALVVLVIRSFTSAPPGSTPHQGPPVPPRSHARAIAEERLARGEISPDEYREIVRALDEGPPRPGM